MSLTNFDVGELHASNLLPSSMKMDGRKAQGLVRWDDSPQLQPVELRRYIPV
jgi:hypothetical protein